jgi:hypothetical protein
MDKMKYIDLIKEGIKINYYGKSISEQDLLKPNSILDETEAGLFIRNYFEAGNKIGMIKEDLIKYRASHCAMCYGLGIMIGKKTGVDKLIVSYFEPISNDKLNNNFEYFWYLCSLYHDIGYLYFKSIDDTSEDNAESIIEDNERKEKNIFGDTSIFNYKVYNLITLISFNDSFLNNYFMFDCEKQLNKYRGMYELEVYKEYFNLRKNKWIKGNKEYREKNEEYDHGIVGGYCFYVNFLENMKYEIDNLIFYKRAERDNPNCKIIIENNYISEKKGKPAWVPEQVIIATDISLTIMSHNIWKSDFLELKKGEYIKISTKKPLLFLLCLVDTIEISKKFNEKHDEKYKTKILDSIDFRITEKGIIITYEKNIYNSDKIYAKWVNNILNLNEWMEVNINKYDNKIYISWKNSFEF